MVERDEGRFGADHALSSIQDENQMHANSWLRMGSLHHINKPVNLVLLCSSVVSTEFHSSSHQQKDYARSR